MSACCVSGCKNRYATNSKLKLYRIPSGYRPFQANRRRLWLQAIQQVNGSTKGLKGHSRICGAHFISGEASMDYNSPDFVPSVFTCTKQSPSHKTKVKRYYGCRKRQHHTTNAETEEKATPPRVDSPVDLQSSVLMDETQTPSTPSVPKEGETLITEAETETETETTKPQATSSPNKASPSFKAPAGILKLDKRSPIVLLKPVFAPAVGYRCELCDQTFTGGSQLVKHKRLHEEEKSFVCENSGKLFTRQADFTEHQSVHEPSFLCNMCDRSFTTSHNLKRHKLLHVKDGRKCPKCGVLFCQRHNHILFLPQAGSITESEEDSSAIVPQELGSNLMPENSLLEKPEPSQTADLDDDSKSTMTITPLLTTTAQSVSPTPPKPKPVSKTHKAPPTSSHARILSKVLLKPSSVPRPLPPVPKYSWNPSTSSQLKPPLPDHPATFVQPLPPQHLELPPSLKMFSPQYLTSALLEVKRNYKYILSKPRNVKKKKEIVKAQQCELSLVSPEERSVERDKKESTAYELEIVL